MSDPQQPQDWQQPPGGQQPQDWQQQQGWQQPPQGGQQQPQDWQQQQGWQQQPQGWQQQPQGWQQPPPGSPPPPGFPAPGYGQSRPARRRPRFTPWIIAAALIAAVGGGFAAFQNFSSPSPKGSIVLPSSLLNLSRATSTGANQLAGRLVKAETTTSHGKLTNVKAGVYGTPTAAWLAVAGGGICGNCYAKSPSALKNSLKNALVIGGYSNVRLFPPGPKGGALACGSRSSGAVTLLHCIWADSKTAGDIIYAGGAASDLPDAAAKSNQVRAAVER